MGLPAPGSRALRSVRAQNAAGTVRSTAYYRCRARTLAPGSAALAAHPCTVNLREDLVTARINEWIGSLFVPHNRVDPAAVVDPINRAYTERDAARACLAHPEQQPELYNEEQVRAMIDELGDVGAAIGCAGPDRLARLYRELDIGVRYQPTEFGGSATVTMRVANECVRGGT